MIQEIANSAATFLENMTINGTKATVDMIERQVCSDVYTHDSHKSRSLTAICGAVINPFFSKRILGGWHRKG